MGTGSVGKRSEDSFAGAGDGSHTFTGRYPTTFRRYFNHRSSNQQPRRTIVTTTTTDITTTQSGEDNNFGIANISKCKKRKKKGNPSRIRPCALFVPLVSSLVSLHLPSLACTFVASGGPWPSSRPRTSQVIRKATRRSTRSRSHSTCRPRRPRRIARKVPPKTRSTSSSCPSMVYAWTTCIEPISPFPTFEP